MDCLLITISDKGCEKLRETEGGGISQTPTLLKKVRRTGRERDSSEIFLISHKERTWKKGKSLSGSSNQSDPLGVFC